MLFLGTYSTFLFIFVGKSQRVQYGNPPNMPLPQIPPNQSQPMVSCSNNSMTFLLNLVCLIIGAVNIAIIGYNFGYYKVRNYFFL